MFGKFQRRDGTTLAHFIHCPKEFRQAHGFNIVLSPVFLVFYIEASNNIMFICLVQTLSDSRWLLWKAAGWVVFFALYCISFKLYLAGLAVFLVRKYLTMSSQTPHLGLIKWAYRADRLFSAKHFLLRYIKPCRGASKAVFCLTS